MKKFIGSLLVLIFCFSFNVSASALIDTNKDASITINHRYENLPLTQVQCSVYKVASLSDKGYYSITDDFKKYQIDFNQISDETEWYQVADTLEGYAIADKIVPHKSEKTSEDGVVKFSNLDTGLYLVSIDNYEHNDGVLKTKPSLVSLPGKHPDGGPLYDVEVNTKCSFGIKDLKVNKVWINDNELNVRPDSIEVDLYRDGEKFETVTLNEKNNWSYLWRGLDINSKWTIIESKVPNGYVVSCENYSETITLTNKYLNGESIDTDGIANSNPAQTGDDLPILPFVMLIIGGILLFVSRKK